MSITEVEAAALADDLRRLADMVADNPTVAAGVYSQVGPYNRMLIPVMHTDDPIAAMRDWIRTGLDANAKVKKSFEDEYANVDLIFAGGLRIHVYAQREQVCQRVVTGTREVTETVPDPEALKAVPQVAVTKVVEDVDWICHPLLADDREQVKA